MENDPFGDVELNFPLLCNFRVIAEDSLRVQSLIEACLYQLGIASPLKKSNTSASGKYVTFQFDFMVNSKEEMGRIDKALRSIDGVRMVL